MSTPASENFAYMNPTHVATLRSSVAGRVLTPNDDGYDQARQIWNAMIDKRPALIAQCANTEDVQQAVSFARERALVQTRQPSA